MLFEVPEVSGTEDLVASPNVIIVDLNSVALAKKTRSS